MILRQLDKIKECLLVCNIAYYSFFDCEMTARWLRVDCAMTGNVFEISLIWLKDDCEMTLGWLWVDCGMTG